MINQNHGFSSVQQVEERSGIKQQTVSRWKKQIEMPESVRRKQHHGAGRGD
jgi:hypothetical protein